jgi:hypothetical protein
MRSVAGWTSNLKAHFCAAIAAQNAALIREVVWSPEVFTRPDYFIFPSQRCLRSIFLGGFSVYRTVIGLSSVKPAFLNTTNSEESSRSWLTF